MCSSVAASAMGLMELNSFPGPKQQESKIFSRKGAAACDLNNGDNNLHGYSTSHSRPAPHHPLYHLTLPNTKLEVDDRLMSGRPADPHIVKHSSFGVWRTHRQLASNQSCC
ncbi:hypothetical protein Ddc_00697 [Ditylenchus destructor]|nr:hypothetical protein Ddc_00697 [Ditylenchus destructor]